MRRARSQLNKLTQQQAGNFDGSNNPHNPNSYGNEVDEIQRRLNALQQQQFDMQHNTPLHNDQMSNHGFPQPLPSVGFQQPMHTSGFQQQHAASPHGRPVMPTEQTPHYAAPVNHPASANPQLDTIKSALEQMSSKLQAINSTNSASKNQQNAVLQQSEVLKQHYNQINAELQGLKNSVAGIATSNTMPDNSLEIIQETLSANYRAIMQQLEGSQNNQIDPSIFSSAIEASHKELSDQIINIKQSIDASLNNPNHYAKTLEVSHEDITKRLDDMHNALQTSIATPDIYVNAIESNHQEVLLQVSQLQQVIENLETNTSEPSRTDLSSVEMRLEEITRAVVALSLNDSSVNNLERIEARVSDIAKTLDSGADSQPIDNSGLDKLEAKLSDIANLMNASSPDLHGMEAQIGALSEKFDEFVAAPVSAPVVEVNNDALIERMNGLSDQIGSIQSSGTSDIQSLETQVGILSEKLENLSSVSTSAPLSAAENNALLQRMDELVEQIGNTQADNKTDVPNDLISQQLTQISNAIDILSKPSVESVNDDSITNEIIVQQLEQIAGAIDQLSLPSSELMPAEKFTSIEQQLHEISSQLNSGHVSALAGSTTELSLDPITDRLSGIEEQLGASRDITIELASKAAEDAVKVSMQAMPEMLTNSNLVQDTNALGSISEHLAQLNQYVENNNSTNVEAFGAVTQSLDLMVKRLGKIEAGLSSYGQNAEVMPVSSAPTTTSSPVTQPTQVMQPEQDFVQTTLAEENIAEPVAQQQEEEQKRNPAADLVAAARLNQKQDQKASAQSQFEMEPVANEVIAEPVGEVQMAVERASSMADSMAEQPILPEVHTPELAMEEIPEVDHQNMRQNEPDIALEPGTGAPDLTALVRQANERRKNNNQQLTNPGGSDLETSANHFLATARRAAQAAAQEAGVVEEEIEDTKNKSLFASLPDLFKKRKKVILMAAAAALFAALALPLASQFLGNNSLNLANVDKAPIIEQSTDSEVEQALTLPAENTVSPTPETVETDELPVAAAVSTPVEESSDVKEVTEPQEVNLANINLNDNPAPVSFIKTDELTFASASLKEAVSKGEPAALFEIGKRYTSGIGVKKDLIEASKWYEKAADQGFAPAQYIIGNFNEKGLGVEKNATVAAEWYKKAAAGGNVIAMHNLAVLTATPNALSPTPDMEQAFKWFTNAADYGVRDSQVNAGIFYTKGFGTEVDLVQAYKWFSIAAKAGDKDAGSKRDVIANAIQPDQLEIAKALVNDWVPLEIIKAANEVTVNDDWKPQASAAAPNLKIDRNVIAQTQRLLGKVGFNAGVADGLMGQKTRNAIAAFQQKAGLPVNGRIDGEFLKALQAVAI